MSLLSIYRRCFCRSIRSKSILAISEPCLSHPSLPSKSVRTTVILITSVEVEGNLKIFKSILKMEKRLVSPLLHFRLYFHRNVANRKQIIIKA